MLLRTRVLQLLVLLERKSPKRFKGFIRKTCYSLWMKLPALTRSSLRLERVACLQKAQKPFSQAILQEHLDISMTHLTPCENGGLRELSNVPIPLKQPRSTSNRWRTSGVRIPTCTTCGYLVNSPKTMTMR